MNAAPFAVFFRLLVLGVTVLSIHSLSHGAGGRLPPVGGLVNYLPSDAEYQINTTLLPYTATYPLTITRPIEVSGSVTVNVTKQVLASPTTDLVASAYVKVTAAPPTPTSADLASVTFDTDFVTVFVTLSLPRGAPVGDYAYKILTADWPGASTTQFLNSGSDINASISQSAPAPTSPTVTIHSPASSPLGDVAASAFPVVLDLVFEATAPDNDDPSVITSVSADITGPRSPSISGLVLGGNVPNPPYEFHVAGEAKLQLSAVGTYTVIVRATNAGGTTSATHTFTVSSATPPVAAPVFSSLDHTAFNAGRPGTFAVQASGAPTFAAVLHEPLRSWLRLDPFTGVLSGTIPPDAVAPSYIFEITATNAGGTTSQTFTLWVNGVPTTPPLLPCGTALVLHGPTLNGHGAVDGSLTVLSEESVTLNGQAWIGGTLTMVGTPKIVLTGTSFIGNVPAATGPVRSNHALTLNGQSMVGALVEGATASSLAAVDHVFSSTVDIKVTGNAPEHPLLEGAYRNVTVNGNNTLVLGARNYPQTYEIDTLTLAGNSRMRIDGPVTLILKNTFTANGDVGAPDKPVTLKISNGGLVLHGDTKFHGSVEAPAGKVTIDGTAVLKGTLMSGGLTINGFGLLDCGCGP